MRHEAHNSTCALIVVAKRPSPGSTKTRLSPPLSPEEAADLYECFLLDVLDLVRQAARRSAGTAIRPVLAFLPETEGDYFRTIAPDFECLPQQGGDLGERLDNALTHYLHDGCRSAAVMNSDSPTLPPAYLVEVFNALAGGADVALGPCDDGGYYLIGMNRPAPRLLREVRMSTPTVTADTLALAAEEKLRVYMLPVWHDVDDAQSLARLIDELRSCPEASAVRTRRFLQAQGMLSIEGRR